MKKEGRRRRDVILLKDLAPVKDVKGGAGKGKRLFGERIEEQPARQSEKKSRRPEKSKG